jgi:transcriptional regulator with XRE-family HTH domain
MGTMGTMGSDETFGGAVRRLRESTGVSLRRFSRTVGVSPTYLSRIECAHVPPPITDKIVSIARSLGVDPNALLKLAGKDRYSRLLSASTRLSDQQLEQLTLLAELDARRVPSSGPPGKDSFLDGSFPTRG